MSDTKVGQISMLIGGKFKRLVKSDDEGNAPGSWDIEEVAQ